MNLRVQILLVLLTGGQLLKAEVRVRPDTNAMVGGVMTEKVSKVRAGQTIEWDMSEPLAVFQENSIPVILVPVSHKEEIKVRAARYEKGCGNAAVVSTINNIKDAGLPALLENVLEIQKLSREKQFKLAYERYLALRNNYPNEPFLDFLGGSLALLMGDRSQARTLASHALSAYPNFADGKTFLKSLEEER